MVSAWILALLLQQGAGAPETGSPPGSAVPSPIRVMSFNIRYGSAKDGPNRWELRRDLLIETIREFRPDLLGLQEALDFQIEAIRKALPDHEVYGKGRDADGGGEHCCLLVRRERFEVHAHGTFWLSETPAAPGSKSWDAALPRICTWAKLRDRAKGGFLAVLNTHLDHRGELSRWQAARLLVERLHLFDGLPCLLMGDFNAGEDSRPVTELTGEGLRDSYRILHPKERLAGTFNGFSGRVDGDKIDAIFVNRLWNVVESSIVRKHSGERYPSDHFPVTAVLEVKK